MLSGESPSTDGLAAKAGHSALDEWHHMLCMIALKTIAQKYLWHQSDVPEPEGYHCSMYFGI